MPQTSLTDTSTHQVLSLQYGCPELLEKCQTNCNRTLSLEYDDIVEGELPQFEVSDIKFEQSIEAPLTPTDTATLSGSSSYTSGLNVYPCIQPPGHVATKNGTGGGGVGLCVRRIGDNGAWQELEVGCGQIGPKLKPFLGRCWQWSGVCSQGKPTPRVPHLCHYGRLCPVCTQGSEA